MNIGDLLKVTRDDIQDFPGDTIELILELQKEGWRAQRSNRNHVMLLAPDGVTKYSASRNASSAKYLREDIARYKRSVGDELAKEEEVPKQEKVPCPRPDCPKFFASLDHLNFHIAVDHEGRLGCPEKDCFETFSKANVLGRHRQLVHGYVSPKYAKRKAQEAKRAEKNVLDDIIDTVDMGELGTDSDETPAVSDEMPNPKPARFGVDVVETYMEGVGAFNSSEDVRVDRTENDVEFIDNRDSWVIAHKPLRRRRIEDIEQTYAAAGLKMEIRVWREKND